MSRVSVIIASHNSSHYLHRCLAALSSQEGDQIEPILVDNGSTDDSVAVFRYFFSSGTVIENPENLGYSVANNQGILASNGKYVLLLNCDCFLGDGYLALLLSRLASHPRLAGIQGKYVRDHDPSIIDSLGIRIRRSGVATDIDRGAADVGRPAEPFEVSGVCTAAALFRREALEDVIEDGCYFDPDFISYYEDVDLCLRLHRRGWRLECDPKAVARHVRGGSQLDTARMHRLALRNKYFTLVKNHRPIALAGRLPFVLGWEALKIPYFLLTSPRSLAGYIDVIRDLPLFFRKRLRV